jgi:coiled-coil and C2 domain-containing protein 2A
LELSSFVSDDQTTYIKIMLTFDPVLPRAGKLSDDFSPASATRNDRGFAIYFRSWLDEMRKLGDHTKYRPYQAFGMHSSGQNMFLCRYLTPQAPPPGFQSMRACLHLVSAIPFMKDAQMFIGELDLWCTSTQLWEIGAGDEEEHAIMLYNYLRFLKTSNGDNYIRGVDNNRRSSNVSTTSGLRTVMTYPSDEIIRNESLFLVLGRAIPEGDTVYLLMRDPNARVNSQTHSSTHMNHNHGEGSEIVDNVVGSFGHMVSYYRNPNEREIFGGLDGEYLVIDPCRGHIFSTRDPYCPLKEIFCLATPYNIWANVQETTAPSTLSYDILNTSYWRPFFGKKNPPPAGGLSSIQDAVSYYPTDIQYCTEIEKSLHQRIRNDLRRWRSKRHRSTTTFHPEACNVLLELLPKLEEWKRTGTIQQFSLLIVFGSAECVVFCDNRGQCSTADTNRARPPWCNQQ